MRRSVTAFLAFPAFLALWLGTAIPALAGEWSSTSDTPWTATSPDFPGLAVPLDSLGGPPRVLSWQVDYRYEDIGYLRYYGGQAGTSILVAPWRVVVIDTAAGTVLSDYVEIVEIQDGDGRREEVADVSYAVDAILVYEPPSWLDDMGSSGEPVTIAVHARSGPEDYGPDYGAGFCEDCSD